MQSAVRLRCFVTTALTLNIFCPAVSRALHPVRNTVLVGGGSYHGYPALSNKIHTRNPAGVWVPPANSGH